MVIRRADRCASCGVDLPAGTRAEWDSSARAVTCLPCAAEHGGTAVDAPTGVDLPVSHPEPESDPSTQSTVPRPLDVGTPGASARAEHDRRQARREARIEERWGTGRLGRLAKALSDDPQSTKAWAQGAAGEERVAAVLHERLRERAVLLHDRRVPGTRGNIDHIAIAASGVWIIDAKRYRGKVERRDVGGVFRADLRLFVGGRDRTTLVQGLQWQHDAVVTALGGTPAPVHRVLCFVDADWSLFARPIRLDEVVVVWPRKLAELIDEPGPLDPDGIASVAGLLSEQLPATGSG